MSRSLFLTFVVLGSLAQRAVAQVAQGDIELLGQVYSTRPPAAYYALKARQPDAFQFQNVWLRRGVRRVGNVGGAGVPGVASAVGPRSSPVQGTFHFPLVIGLFGDSPAQEPFSRADIQAEFFDGQNSYYKTIPEFYQELSGGKVRLVGHTHGWVRATLTQSQVAANESALPGRIGEYILQVLTAADDGSIDWGLYDNDGPDGVPNSADDDGFVDILAVMHPTTGAECDGGTNRVWSHKWNLQAATGQTYRTQSPSARGGFIRINDYTVQPAFACGALRINQIGVFAHELGHAFGLPDLYCTASNCAHSAIGRWGLMGSGAWGCAPPPSNRPDRPCHMGAWEKEMLGWVDVQTLPAGMDLGALTLGPVETGRKVMRVDAADGSGDYFLLENRTRQGFDADVPAEGMLVWRIDGLALQERWGSNTVNNDRSRISVGLVQADGKNDLTTLRCGTNCGDAGDPFPGATGNLVLHTGSTPSTRSHLGSASGLTLLDIQRTGTDVSFRALTRFQQVLLRTSGSASTSASGLLTVDGQVVGATTVRAAPFQPLTIEAAAGVPVTDGVRFAFERWLDVPGTSRARTFVTGFTDAELVAEYGNRREVQVRPSLEGGQFGVQPGRLVSVPASSDLWFEEGSQVSLRAEPTTGFGFVRWTGAMAGKTNPATLQLSGPVDAGALFELTYHIGGSATTRVPGAAPAEVLLMAEGGSAPFYWSLLEGRVPNGMTFRPEGIVSGTPTEPGSFPLKLQARDGSGLLASGTVTIEVVRPVVGVQEIVGPFLGRPSALSEAQRIFLDSVGNRNGVYDLGDMRVFFLANRDLPMTAEQRALVRTLLPTVSFGPGGGGR